MWWYGMWSYTYYRLLFWCIYFTKELFLAHCTDDTLLSKSFPKANIVSAKLKPDGGSHCTVAKQNWTMLVEMCLYLWFHKSVQGHHGPFSPQPFRISLKNIYIYFLGKKSCFWYRASVGYFISKNYKNSCQHIWPSLPCLSHFLMPGKLSPQAEHTKK